MTRAKELGQRAGRAQKKAIRDAEIPALLGKVRSDGSVSLRGDTANSDLLPTNQVYVRLHGLDGDTPRVAYCTAVGLKANNGVYVRENHDKTLSVVRLWDKRATEFLGAQAADFAAPTRSGAAPNFTDARDLLPGRIQIWVSGTLKLHVSRPFWYFDTDGSLKYWNTPAAGFDDGTCLDVGSNVPAASGGVNQGRWVAISFDNDASAPGFVATDGTAQYTTLPRSVADIEDISLPEGQLLLGALWLETGDTDETTVTESDFVDLRLWTGGTNAGAAASVAWDDIAGKPSTFAPAAHASSHQSGGSDAIKLDDLATPDDNTDLDATTERHGLLPKLDGSTANFLRGDGTWAKPPGSGGGGGSALQYTLIRDQRTSGTHSDSVASGAWRTRTLNTIVEDDTGAFSLSSNQITVPAGTYKVECIVPNYRMNIGRAKLYDVTNGVDLMYSINSRAANNQFGNTNLIIKGKLVVASPIVVEVQHRVETTETGGLASSYATEHYTTIEFLKYG